MTDKTRALIFDSHYDDYRGVVVYCRVFDGALRVGDRIRMMGTGQRYTVSELGRYRPAPQKTDQLQHAFRQLFKKHGITEPQYNVLRILRGAGPDGLPCLAIGERMVTRVPDVTRLLDRLECSEYVSRERSKNDRRVVVARITRKGLGVLEKLDDPTLRRHADLLGHLSAEEVAELNRLLEKARDR